MNDNINHVIVSLPSNRGWKKAERLIEDIAPTKILSGASIDDFFDSDSSTPTTELPSLPQNESGQIERLRSSNICLVCLENESRYTCPRCRTPYCSIECYRNHTNAHSCTEEFFKKKVTSLMQLESFEKQDKNRRALNQYRQEGSNHLGFQEIFEGHYDEIESLYELRSQLDILEDDNQELSTIELTKLLPPPLKAIFLEDLRTGKLEAESILNRWHPWWEREFVRITGAENEKEKSDVNDNNHSDESSNFSVSKTLDTRLLAVPNYKSLRGKNTTPPLSKNNDNVLACNLLDILYGTCRTLRLYHGLENASRQAPVEATTTLISTSTVLGKDARFTSIFQVLNHHYNCAIESSRRSINVSRVDNVEAIAKIKGHPTEWNIYMEDIAALVASPRMVGRALLEASDILKAAVKELKIECNRIKTKKKECNDGSGVKLNQIRRLRKKLEFFLSWTTDHPVAVTEMKQQVLYWIDERRKTFSEFQFCEDDDGGNINRSFDRI